MQNHWRKIVSFCRNLNQKRRYNILSGKVLHSQMHHFVYFQTCALLILFKKKNNSDVIPDAFELNYNRILLAITKIVELRFVCTGFENRPIWSIFHDTWKPWISRFSKRHIFSFWRKIHFQNKNFCTKAF